MDDVAAINNQRQEFNLKYKGKSASTARPMLHIDVCCPPSLSIAELLRQEDPGSGLRLHQRILFHRLVFAIYRRLRLWFPDFTTVNLIALGFMFELFRHFGRQDICCHISASFPTYLAGMQTGFNRVSFIAMKESPLVNLIFQRGETLR